MRIDLNTTYAERHTAKALGARWDYEKRVWYIIDPTDLASFLKWIPSAGASPLVEDIPVYKNVQSTNKMQRHSYGITGPVHVPHCGCNALPWEHCAHTLAKDGMLA